MTSSGDSADWVTGAIDTVERYVGMVRDNATSKVLTALRALVFGVVIIVMAIMALVLFVVMAIRFMNAYLPQRVWLSYLILGMVFLAVGFWLWSKRRPSPEKS
jgi:NADH:ubiquinone oxidoreductase subunit 6 (subunit J)